MSRIEKTVVGYLDLDKVIAVGNPMFFGHGPIVVGFEITVQLVDKPIVFAREVFGDEVLWNGQRETLLGVDGNVFRSLRGDISLTVAGVNIQKTIDEFVAQWKRKPWWKIWG